MSQNVLKPLTIAAALSFLYATVLAKLGQDWWTDPNYSHGLLMPFIIGYLLWADRARFERAPRRPMFSLGLGMTILALLALWAGTAGAELYMQRLSLVLMLSGVIVYFWGTRILHLAFVPLLLVWLSLPIPTIVFNKIAFPLQLFASRCAVWAMRLFDIPVLRQGNVIELMPLGSATTKKLEVVEACSGIRSLMTLVTLAVVFAYFTTPRSDRNNIRGGGRSDGSRERWWKSYGFWRALILVLSAVPIAILTNALRVSGTGVLSRYYGTEIADGFFHEFSGWVIYIVAFLLLFIVGWVIDLIWKKKAKTDEQGGHVESSAISDHQQQATQTEGADENSSLSGATPAVVSVSGADGSIQSAR